MKPATQQLLDQMEKLVNHYGYVFHPCVPSQAKRFVNGYRSHKNANAIQTYMNNLLEPDDPLYGWGLLAHHLPREVLEPSGMEVIQAEEIVPTGFTILLRAALVGELEVSSTIGSIRQAKYRALRRADLPADIHEMFLEIQLAETKTGTRITRGGKLTTTRPY
jgi:hypothetical protein